MIYKQQINAFSVVLNPAAYTKTAGSHVVCAGITPAP